MSDTARLPDIIDGFRGKRIVVVGDAMLDRYLWGEVRRISPEAPVPVVRIEEETHAPGGAANTASNVVALGAACHLVCVIGTDAGGDRLVKALQERGVITDGVIRCPHVQTIEKTRVIGSRQQLCRIDHEKLIRLGAYDEQVIRAMQRIGNADIIVVSDYAKGLLSEALIRRILELGPRVVVDPKPQTMMFYRGAFLIKPNLYEAAAAAGIPCDDDQGVVRAGKALRERLGSNILLTRDKDGISLFTIDGQAWHVPTRAREIADVSGAGDTVIATAACSLAAGATLYEASVLANAAASLSIAKPQTATVSRKELREDVTRSHSKLKSWEELAGLCADLRRKGKRIVFTNGCFDIIHPGHTRYLQQARRRGDTLVLGLNSDASVRRLKGPERPLVKQQDRAEVLAALSCVDYIAFFDQDVPLELIGIVKPQVFAKGADWKGKNIPELEIIKEWGGEAAFIDLVEGRSTTSIVERIMETEKTAR